MIKMLVFIAACIVAISVGIHSLMKRSKHNTVAIVEDGIDPYSYARWDQV